MKARGVPATAAIALAALALFAPAASASFHDMQIREVYPGSAAAPNAEYVELQMWAAGQNLVGGHTVQVFDSTGAVKGMAGFAANVPRGESQSTLVLATAEAAAQFGIVADAPIAPSGLLDPAGGAVCWELIDCVSWGNFNGSPPSPTGPPAAAAGIPDGMALRRTIEPGCSTLLEFSDDRDNSATDFLAVTPAPRPNSVAPTELACVASGGGGAPPQTVLKRKPPKRSSDRTPTFRFGASEAGARFECSFDRRRFRSCRSPLTAKPLTPGKHVFRVRARGRSGTRDPSPASYAFTIVTKHR